MPAVKNAKPAPAQTKLEPGKQLANLTTPEAPSAPPPHPVAAAPVKYRYYRVRKITGFLSELLSVEIDESVTPGKIIGKQDDRGNVLDHMTDLADIDAKAYLNAELAAKAKAGK
jgi:hypothetical protein